MGDADKRTAVIKNPAGKKYSKNSDGIKISIARAITSVGRLANATSPKRISLKGLKSILHTGLYMTVTTAKRVPTCSIMLKKRSGVKPNSFCARIRCPLLLTGKNSVAPCKIPNNIPCNTVKMFLSLVYKTAKVMYNDMWYSFFKKIVLKTVCKRFIIYYMEIFL